MYKSMCKEDGAGEDKEDGAGEDKEDGTGEDSAPFSIHSPKRHSMWWWDDPVFPPQLLPGHLCKAYPVFTRFPCPAKEKPHPKAI